MSLKSLALCLGVLLTSFLALAQQLPAVHTHFNPDVIDGSKTPKQIPDLTAWRLWLLSVAAKDPNHPELDQARQDAYLLQAGFEQEDLPVMRQALYEFTTAYDAMVADHNQSVAAGFDPSVASFKARRDSLVKEAQRKLLSVKVETEARVRSFINNEKKRMRVSKTEVQ